MVTIAKDKKRAILILNVILPFLLGIGIDLYVPSFPAIGRYFHVESHWVQWTITAYMLGYGSGQFLLGIISDFIGRRPVLLGSLFAYLMVTIVAIFASSIHLLILMRLLQGLAVGGVGAVCRTIVTDSFTGDDLTKAMSYLSASWAMGPILGPFIGGYLQHYFNWQASFVFYALYALFLIIYILAVVPETNRVIHKPEMRVFFSQLKSVLTHATFVRFTLGLSLIYGILVLFNMIGPYLVQVTLHYTAVDYGHIALLMGFGYFLGNMANRWLIQYFSGEQIVRVGMGVSIALMLLALALDYFIPLRLSIVIVPIFLMFISCGIVFPNKISVALGEFSHIGGVASSIFGSIAVGMVSLITIFGALLPTTSAWPLALVYLVLLLVAAFLFAG